MSKQGTNISWMTDGREDNPDRQVVSRKGGTLNSLVGCSAVSPGCVNCYAVSDCHRMGHNTRMAKDYEGTVKKVEERLCFTGKVNYLKDRLMDVLNDPNHRAWFVNSLSDLYHENVADEIIIEHFDVFTKAYWQEFRVLTKRHERLAKIAPQIVFPTNVQVGVTVEDVKRLERISALGKTRAVHKFVSFEPWLSPWPWKKENSIVGAFPMEIDGVRYDRLSDLLKQSGVECCIVGGESDQDAHHARYMDLRDAAYILEAASAAGAHPCLKQLGTRWAVASNTAQSRCIDGTCMKRARHGAVKELWPEAFQSYSQHWPFLTLPARLQKR